jgi:hypothetical protein
MKQPTEFLAGLGRVVLRWSLFEHNLASVTMDLIGASGGEAPVRSLDIAISLVKELRFRALAVAALNIYRARIGEDAGFEQLSAIIKRAEKLADQRINLFTLPIPFAELKSPYGKSPRSEKASAASRTIAAPGEIVNTRMSSPRLGCG